MSQKEFSPGNPARQGFYRVQTEDGRELIAAWREFDKKTGKRWWEYISEHAAIEKKPHPLEGVKGYALADKAAVAKLLERELTEEEKIQASYEAYRSRERFAEAYLRRFAIPESRKLVVGDAVEVGALQQACVVSLRDEGQAVVIRHRNISRKYGEIIDGGWAYGTWHWTDVLKKSDFQATSLATHGVFQELAYRNTDLRGVLHRAAHGDLADNPDYQRGYVWTDFDKQSYLESLFEGRDLGRFVIVRNHFPHLDELLDGKQRMSTLLEFYFSQIAYKGLYWHQLSTEDRNDIESRGVQYAELDARVMSRAKLLEVFLAVNGSGVPQTEEHLAHVRELLKQERDKKSP